MSRAPRPHHAADPRHLGFSQPRHLLRPRRRVALRSLDRDPVALLQAAAGACDVHRRIRLVARYRHLPDHAQQHAQLVARIRQLGARERRACHRPVTARNRAHEAAPPTSRPSDAARAGDREVRARQCVHVDGSRVSGLSRDFVSRADVGSAGSSWYVPASTTRYTSCSSMQRSTT